MRIDATAAGIGPEEFWRLTPLEIGLTVRGYSQRLAHLQYIVASNVAPLVSAWGGKGAARQMINNAKKGLED